jgi:replication-associated recombination protein RarA
MKDLGYGQGYTWDVRSEQFEAVKGYLPDELAQQRFYDEWETDKPEELQS